MRVAQFGFALLAALFGLAVPAYAQATADTTLPLITRTPLVVRTPRTTRKAVEPVRQTGMEVTVHGEPSECSTPLLHWAHRLGWKELDECPDTIVGHDVSLIDPNDWGFAIDWLYLTARGNDFPYAYPACDCAEEPDGPAGLLDFDYEPAYRWRASRRVGGLWLDVAGLHFLGETGNAIGAAAPHELRDLVFLSAAPDANFAAARNELKLTAIDADLRGTLFAGSCIVVELFGGVPAARIDQNADFYFLGSDWGSASVDVRGAGVRGGLQTTGWYGNCFAWWRSALSLLAAQVELDYMQHRAGGPATVSEYHISDDRLVPTLDLEFGLGYQLPYGWAISAGYLYSVWFNVASPEDFVADLRAGSYYGDVDDELSFDGFFLRVEYGRFRQSVVGN